MTTFVSISNGLWTQTTGSLLPTLTSAYALLRINSSTTAAEWTLSPDHLTRVGIGDAAASTVRLSVVGETSGATKFTFSGTNSGGYIGFAVRDDGLVSFGGSAAANAVWNAYESGGYARLEDTASGGALIGATVGDVYIRAFASGKAVYLDAPTASGIVAVRTGASYDTAFSGWFNSNVGYLAGPASSGFNIRAVGSGAPLILASPTTGGYTVLRGGINDYERIRVDDTGVGFFGTSPVAKQTMGAATAGATWTATEQTMLQAVYDAIRAYGLGT